MIIKTLYRIKRSDDGIDVTPNKPDHDDYTETYRVIADEGMILTDGTITCGCVDTDKPEKYSEIEDDSEETIDLT